MLAAFQHKYNHYGSFKMFLWRIVFILVLGIFISSENIKMCLKASEIKFSMNYITNLCYVLYENNLFHNIFFQNKLKCFDDLFDDILKGLSLNRGEKRDITIQSDSRFLS